MKEGSQIQRYEDLFELWKDVPVVQKVSDQSIFKATNHPIQKSLLKILREGIIDTNWWKRNFLIANELLDHVNHEIEGVDKSIKISMLYYHLDKLQESSLVRYVYFVEGRHKRKYFGRTAKFYLFGDENKDDEKTEKFFDPISKLISHFNPDVDLGKYKALTEEIKSEQTEFSNSLVNWMEINHELLYELDIDPLDLFSSLTVMLVGQGSIRKLISSLAPDMNFIK